MDYTQNRRPSRRPTYAIILLFISGLFMCTTFLPFLYSLMFPDENLRAFVAALEGGAAPPSGSETVVQQTTAAVGTLKRTTKIGHYYQVSSKIHYVEPRTTEKIRLSQDVNIAWFEKHPKPMLVAFACYENDAGQKAYGISEVSPVVVVRGYALPLALFGISLFLVRKRSAADSHQGSVGF